MLVYLIKSGACLGILFFFYTLFLEKENMHVFKRFYLLAALVLALIIPALVFTEYVEVPAKTTTVIEPMTTSNDLVNVQPALEADVLDVAPILWGIYFIGLLFFGVKFIKNLFQIFKRIRNNPKNRLARFTQVLLQETIPPHTFFSYIFLNKKKLEANEIPKEVLLHEETHAQQKHSWDVVFVEFLQVIFWVNPFVYLSKKAIKLNHEFLADQAVLKKDIDETTYQNTLLSYLSPDSEKKYQPTMANPITNSSYSSIKKRFKVMKTHTSRKSVLIKSLLLLPLLALLLYGFSETKIEIISTQPTFEKSMNINLEKIEEVTLTVRITKKGELLIEGQEFTMAAAESHVKELLKRDRIIRAFILPDLEAPKQVIVDVNSMLEQFQLDQINIIGPEKPYNDRFSQKGVTEEQIKEYNSLGKKYNQQKEGERNIRFEDVEKMTEIYHLMTTSQKAAAEPFPSFPPPPPPMESEEEIDALKTYETPSGEVIKVQDVATKKQLAEYNALAKKYNTMLSKSKSIQIKLKDVQRLEYLHELMSDKQKANAEPFPDFPEPPPVPEAPKAPKVKNGEKSTIPPPPPLPPTPNFEKQELLLEKQESHMKEQEILMEQQEVKMEEQEILTQEQESRREEQEILMVEQEARMDERKGELEEMEEEMESEVLVPPTPPTPQSPLDHVIEMAKKDAVFYHEGKEISSDEAIAILKKNKSINIDSRGSNSNRPVVRLSTEPITIDN